MSAQPPPPPQAAAPPMNALQRRYFAWAERHYARMEPAMAAEARRLDLWLYSRRGAWVVPGLGVALFGSVAALVAAGFPGWLALLCSLLVWLGLPMAALGAWLQPHKFTARQLLRRSLGTLLIGYAGAFVGFLIGRLAKRGSLQPETLPEALWAAARAATPFLLLALVAIVLLLWAVAQWRSQRDRRELAQLRLVQERDGAARQAAEARLRLLQAQVQPHFIFNTLAALQHWVDVADPRAPALLRSLSAFLRGSTELLGREQVPLSQELDVVRSYLQVMQARLGERLRHEAEATPEALATPLPPGLLLTLVENAVEHGIAPALAGGRVRLQARCEGDALVLRVHDEGAGLAPQWQPGTGLANVQERLAHHGGRLQLATVADGTEAVITLPRPVPQEDTR